MARTTVVTVTYNSSATIGPMLDALRPAVERGQVEIVLVDNASKDDTLDVLRPYVDAALCRVVSGHGNVGFGRGCNIGASHATTDFVLMLNPDARLDPEAIATLEYALDQNPKADIAAPAIEQDDHTIQPVGALPTRLGMIFDRSPLHPLFVRSWRPTPGEGSRETTWVSGAAFMVRRSALADLGGFDPRFFLYFEESDLFRRIRKSRRQVLIVPKAICHHIGGHSAHTVETGKISNSIAEHFIKSRNYYAAKHFSPPVMWLADAGFFLTLWFRALTSRRPADKVTWAARRGVGLFVMPARVAAGAPGSIVSPISNSLAPAPASVTLGTPDPAPVASIRR